MDDYSDPNATPTGNSAEIAIAILAHPGDPDRAAALRARGFHVCDPAEAPANG